MSNLDHAVQEAWDGSITKQVLRPMPLLAALMERRKQFWRGGKYLRFTLDYVDADSLMQWFTGSNTGLTAGSKTFLSTVQFPWKKSQQPIEYTGDEMLQTDMASEQEAPTGSLVRATVAKGQESVKIGLYKGLYQLPSTATNAATYYDANRIDGLWQALYHDAPYGLDVNGSAITRSGTTTNSWFQGGSIAGDNADVATAYSASITTARKMRAAVSKYEPVMPTDCLYISGSDVFHRVQSQVETHHSYKMNPLSEMLKVKYGFNVLELDGYTYVVDPFLDTQPTGSEPNEDSKKWWFCLNLKYWHFRTSPARDFKLTPFVFQGEQVNGPDKYLARILFAGNFVTQKPRASIGLANVAY